MKRLPTSPGMLVWLFAFCWLCPLFSLAQLPDSLNGLKTFMDLSKSYKQLPLYIDMEIRSSTNFVTSDEDTSYLHAEFFLQSSGAYIKFGMLEQILNDSLVLMVNGDLEKIIIYTNVQPLSQMKQMGFWPVTDSLIGVLSQKYRAAVKSLPNNTSIISMDSRDMLKGIPTPRQSIQVTYNAITDVPLILRTISRSMLPLDQEHYELLKKDPSQKGKVFMIGDNGYLVKERVVSYTYKTINHDAALLLPVTQSERIKKNEEGDYIPVTRFETYSITIN